jgi:hypothetical protein
MRGKFLEIFAFILLERTIISFRACPSAVPLKLVNRQWLKPTGLSFSLGQAHFVVRLKEERESVVDVASRCKTDLPNLVGSSGTSIVR